MDDQSPYGLSWYDCLRHWSHSATAQLLSWKEIRHCTQHTKLKIWTTPTSYTGKGTVNNPIHCWGKMITETTRQTPRVNNIHTEYSPSIVTLDALELPFWCNIFNLPWMVPINWDETTQLITHFPYSLATLKVTLRSVKVYFSLSIDDCL